MLFFVATLWETRGKKRQNSLEIKDSSQKKVLSLVLCVAVMLSVMVLGAGAAFSDQDQIENTEAVNMCSALNIIGGYEDGSFHPERNIKRSEITKMICVALNGGKE
ncbi:MAG TPA: S-layer homology domain-containing protein, partial [Candidatus Evtepia faecigallinarum]|nr:S-layer homology domain-containing protein [Candidatus Evtepia faecigallinarum]